MIRNIHVMGLEGAIIASRYPMMTETPSNYEFMELDEGLQTVLLGGYDKEKLNELFGHDFEEENKFKDRAVKLGRARTGSGHPNFLKGITVAFDWKNSLLVQRQALRYNFLDIVSSQSTMHCALKMDMETQCNDYVWDETKEELQRKIAAYNYLANEGAPATTLEEMELEILYNLPAGYELTARYTTNYLQLKTIYEQRCKVPHKLPDWQDIKELCDQLPCFYKLTGLEG